MSTTLQHIVVQVDEAIVHVYTMLPKSKQLLAEFKQHLKGAYFYDKHQPHASTGQYHLHVYLKNNEIFAINWDGSAHDQSHQKVIPGKVFKALKAEFPDLVLPANRIIEFVCLDASKMASKLVERLGGNDLAELRQLIAEETLLAGSNAFPHFSRFSVYEGSHVPFVGWPLLLMGAEYKDNGDAVAEGHLIWLMGAKHELQSQRFTMKHTDSIAAFGSRLDFLSCEILEWAKSQSQIKADRQWAQDRGAWLYSKPVFNERSFRDLLRFWLVGNSLPELKTILKKTGIKTLQINIGLITRFPPVKWVSENPFA